MDALTQQFYEQANLFLVIEIAGLAFLLAIAAEAVWDRFNGLRPGLRQTLANVATGAVYIGLDSAVYGFVLVIALYIVGQFSPFTIPVTWWSWIAALVVADFSYYWMHRVEHRVQILWAFHSVHHSCPEFNLSTALRLSWLEGLVEWIFFVPMVLLGFGTVQTVAALIIVVSYQNWIHTEKIGKLGVLDRILNTPSVHRVHHGSNPLYHDRNFGGLFIVWDRFFGTYCEEQDRVVYGISRPVSSANPVVINFAEFAALWNDLRRRPAGVSAMKLLTRHPGRKENKSAAPV